MTNDPLQDLHGTGLKGRYEIEESGEAEEEPQTLADSHWRVQPRWLRIATFVFIPPLALIWGYMIRTGESLENQTLMFGIFGFIGMLVILHFFFIIRAYWRMDI